MRGSLSGKVIGNPLFHPAKLLRRDFFVRKILEAAVFWLFSAPRFGILSACPNLQIRTGHGSRCDWPLNHEL
jgi:hypothetical protein